jgi:Phosphotransferase enzyme family
MADFASMLPDTETLTKGLVTAFRSEGHNGKSVMLVDRELSPYSTTFPCEVVTCRVGRTTSLRLFCKYNAGVDYTGHGHRGRVRYEIAVYRDILAASRRFRPKFYGSYLDPDTGDDWLFLEFLDGSLRIGKLGLTGTPKAARWIGRFHAETEPLVASNRLPFLNTYDWDYYLAWVHRTDEFAGSLHQRYPWLRALCDQARELLDPLVAAPQTVIHGEFYPHNVLYHRKQVCPIDWESAAVGNGLIDLVTLTEGWWPEQVVRACIREYQRARWPEGPPPAFDRMLKAAHLYINFRWLGDFSDVTQSQALEHRFDRLATLGRELGAI